MTKVFRVKIPGKPIKTWTGPKLHKERRDIFDLTRDMKPGDKRKFNLGTVRNPRWVGIHFMHPRELSIRDRKKICGRGVRGEARRRFIEEGQTLEEQRLLALPTVAAESAAAVERWKKAHPEEYATRLRARKERAEEKRKKEGRIDYSKYYSPAHIAKSVGCSGLDVRKFLRMKKIGKRGGRYAFKKREAQRIAKALRKHLKEA